MKDISRRMFFSVGMFALKTAGKVMLISLHNTSQWPIVAFNVKEMHASTKIQNYIGGHFSVFDKSLLKSH